MPAPAISAAASGLPSASGADVPATSSSPSEWYAKGSALFRANDWPALAQWSERWSRARPRDLAAWSALGTAYAALGRNDEAIEAFHTALQINPNHAPAWIDLGLTYHRAHRGKEAESAFLAGLRIDPRDAMAWMQLSVIRMSNQQYAEAIPSLREVLAINPTHADALTSLASCYAKTGQLDLSIATYRKSLTIRPKSPMAWEMLGYACSMKSDMKCVIEARDELRDLHQASAIAMQKLIDEGPRPQQPAPVHH
jgi:tetratricopeptide (TPR) repeat protein